MIGGHIMDAGRFIQAMKARDAQEEARLEPIEVSYLTEDIAKGIVKKELYYKNDNPEKPGDLTELAVLTLGPGAEIYQHQHTIDLEYYLDMANNAAILCECGDSHGYINDLNRWMQIVSVKLAVKV